ncbi:uncharacterized protein LOC141813604 [Curcuma longa]|uniref:uncharacterized protein LOC141813604 n=1 Tax=Curcuma longa TaxID=136217 RepID=UPI003D9DBDCE
MVPRAHRPFFRCSSSAHGRHPRSLAAPSRRRRRRRAAAPSHGWQKVTYSKRQRKPQPQADPDRPRLANGLPDRSHVFDSVEQKARERRRAIEAAAAAAEAVDLPRSRPPPASSDDDDDDEGAAKSQENSAPAPKKEKPKKVKKPKVTVDEAAAKIDATDLATFLAEISATYESQQDIQLMRFADFFARSFASVNASQFPWFKIFKESPVEKIIDDSVTPPMNFCDSFKEGVATGQQVLHDFSKYDNVDAIGGAVEASGWLL